jgi:predicted nuclease of predicted toxin-antitoxin system
MKLLFDQNLSPKLPARLSDLYPGSDHVANHGLDQATDQQVWDFALANGFTIVTKDADFPNLAVLRGHPPKVIWLQLGNCTTQEVEDAVRGNDAAAKSFEGDPSVGVLEIQ